MAAIHGKFNNVLCTYICNESKHVKLLEYYIYILLGNFTSVTCISCLRDDHSSLLTD